MENKYKKLEGLLPFDFNNINEQRVNRQGSIKISNVNIYNGISYVGMFYKNNSIIIEQQYIQNEEK